MENNDDTMRAARPIDLFKDEKNRLIRAFVISLVGLVLFDIGLSFLWINSRESVMMSRYFELLKSQKWHNNIDPIAAALTLTTILVAMFLATSLGRESIQNLAVQEVVRRRALDELTRIFGLVTALTLHFATIAILIFARTGGIWIAVFLLSMSLLAVALSAMCAVPSAYWRKAAETEEANAKVLEKRINAAIPTLGGRNSKVLAFCKGIAWLAAGNALVTVGLILVRVGAGFEIEMAARSWALSFGLFVLFLSLPGIYVIGLRISAPIKSTIGRGTAWLGIFQAICMQLLWALGVFALMFEELRGVSASEPLVGVTYPLVGLYVLYPWAGACFWRKLHWWSVIQVPLLRWAMNQSKKAKENFGKYESAAERRRLDKSEYDVIRSESGDGSDQHLNGNPQKDGNPQKLNGTTQRSGDGPTKQSLSFSANQSVLAHMMRLRVSQKRRPWVYFISGAWISAMLIAVCRSERRL